jgi:hypothetical protein
MRRTKHRAGTAAVLAGTPDVDGVPVALTGVLAAHQPAHRAQDRQIRLGGLSCSVVTIVSQYPQRATYTHRRVVGVLVDGVGVGVGVGVQRREAPLEPRAQWQSWSASAGQTSASARAAAQHDERPAQRARPS